MFDRLSLLIDDDILNDIKNTHVLLVGVGGVGGACLEALVRLGIGYITIIDNDVFDYSNLNRQILSNCSNIGVSKVKEAKLRALSINPDIFVYDMSLFLNEANIDEIDFNSFDYIIDCCDTMSTKYLLIKKSLEYNKVIISSMGTGNRLDPTKLEITDIWKTSYDPVAKAIRNILRKNNIKAKIPVVCSKEVPIKLHSRTPGSTSLVPNVAGFYLASFVFNDIINRKRK